VMNVPVVAGRPFTPADESGTPPVAILTASTAQKYWPGKNSIGRHIRFAREDEWRTVVGIIADVRAYDLQRNVPDWMNGAVYVPYSPKATMEDERIPAEMTLVLQTAADDTQIGTTLRGLVNALNPEVPVTNVKTMRTVISDAVATPASTASLFVTFAVLALVLGLIGIYGVLAFLVSRRTREIGIRIAMGAQRRDVLWLVLKEGAKFAAIGIPLGLTGALIVTRWMSSELYGVSALDPLTFGSVALVMAIVTMLACYIPARRAMAVDPLVALRYE